MLISCAKNIDSKYMFALQSEMLSWLHKSQDITEVANF